MWSWEFAHLRINDRAPFYAFKRLKSWIVFYPKFNFIRRDHAYNSHRFYSTLSIQATESIQRGLEPSCNRQNKQRKQHEENTDKIDTTDKIDKTDETDEIDKIDKTDEIDKTASNQKTFPTQFNQEKHHHASTATPTATPNTIIVP